MKILIVDDHSLFSDGLSHIVKQLSDDTHITTANSVNEAIGCLADSSDFDLILLDINMPGMDGLGLLQRLNAEEMCIPAVVVSSETKPGIIRQAIELGAMGFIPKSYNAERMLAALQMVLEGSLYLSEEVQSQLKKLPASGQDGMTARLKQIGISKKQHQTLELLAKGLSNQQIATMLCRSENTIKSHISALFQVLGASNRTECVKLAIEQQLLEEQALLELEGV